MAADISSAIAIFVASAAAGAVELRANAADPTVGSSATDSATRRAIMVRTRRIAVSVCLSAISDVRLKPSSSQAGTRYHFYAESRLIYLIQRNLRAPIFRTNRSF